MKLEGDKNENEPKLKDNLAQLPLMGAWTGSMHRRGSFGEFFQNPDIMCPK